ncbi:hypothetical protein B0H10DRAFT_1930375 [Mycena sp. CBHHK59/15]|nr:hypothetical protein B0H10DRAFT_1930375 [Mycena sp. CBHHK59/15]
MSSDSSMDHRVLIGASDVCWNDNSAASFSDVQPDIDQDALDMFNLADSMFTECKAASDISELDTAIYLFRHAIYLLRRDGLPRRPELKDCLNTFATALLTRFSYTAQFDDVVNAFGLRRGEYRDIAGKLEAGLALNVEADPSDILKCASAILADFHGSVDLSTLDTAILLHREALSLRAASDPNQWRSLFELSDALLIGFRLTGRDEDLYESIALLRQLHLMRPNRSLCLCAALITGLRADGPIDPAQLQEATQLFDEAMDSNNKAVQLWESGTDFLRIFQQSNNLFDLDAAVSSLEEAEHYMSWGHENRAVMTNNLALALRERIKQRGGTTDLDRAIELHGEALALQPAPPPHIDRASALNNLATALQELFQQRGNMTDLNKTIELLYEALTLKGNASRDIFINNLACALRRRFELCGSAEDLEGAVELYRAALALHQAQHPFRSSSLSHLGTALHARIRLKGDVADLDCAVDLYREALSLQPAPHPDRSSSLSHLGAAFDERFNKSGDWTELEHAIELHREALALLQVPHQERDSYLFNLATSIYERYVLTSDKKDLDSAIILLREVLALQPAPHPHRGKCLSSLGKALRGRFEKWGDMAEHQEKLLFKI